MDTHQLVKKLKERGFSEEQATGITEAVQEIDLSQLATKGDVQELTLAMAKLKSDLMKWNASMIAIGVAVLALLKFF